jgi:hypothetical protein
MAGPGDEMAARAGGWGHLRASHADRERVVGVLKAAFVEGRLAKDEFELRVGQTFAARTYAELAALTADLPGGITAAKPRRPSQAALGPAVVWPGRVITAASALYAGVWAVLLLSPLGENPLAQALIPNATLVYLGVLIICLAAILARRGDGRIGERPPRGPGAHGPASSYLPPDAADGQLPPADPGHRHTAKAVQRHRPQPPSPVRWSSTAKPRMGACSPSP